MFGGRWGSKRSRRGSVEDEDEDGGGGSVAIVKTWGICTGAECSLMARITEIPPRTVTRLMGMNYHSTDSETEGVQSYVGLWWSQ